MAAKPPRDPDLVTKIRQAKPGDPPFCSKLQTSERVLRRVTDGIYREPWAAIRELISNAYDADATRVVINTDPPRFMRITVRDNGNGFTAEALASMCQSIGGSPKRTTLGADLGITAKDDPDLSPGGRRLIGKLGIGLFSVSQLTQQFRIITKVKGSRERTIADVILFRYAESHSKTPQGHAADVETTGEVQITKVVANDIDAHGTDVIIDKLLLRTRDEFQSRDLWQLIRNPPGEAEGGGSVIQPIFHIGYTDPQDPGAFAVPPALPWQEGDDALLRFRRVVMAMYDRAGPGAERKPSLATTFDNYLRFLWLIALSAPIDYIDKHPFDLDRSAGLRVFALGSMRTGKAQEVRVSGSETIRRKFNLRAPERGGTQEFVVIMDGLEMRRPLRFTDLPKTTHRITTPLLFISSQNPDMSKFDDRNTGGPLQFEAYLLWCPRIVPVEHNGVLIRIGDASGSLFDETFMRYQVSEQTRREQVTAEVFVNEGMDAALNIDRESFNHAHPHFQYIAAWVHDAFKQFATKHKALGSEIRKQGMVANHVSAIRELSNLVEAIVSEWTDGQEEPVVVQFKEDDSLLLPQGEEGILVLPAALQRYLLPPGQRNTGKSAIRYKSNQDRLAAISQLLYVAGVLDPLSAERRRKLLIDVARIVFFRGAE